MGRRSGSRKVSVLISGFEPFGRFKVNPSEVLVRQYKAQGLKDIDGATVSLTRLILPVHNDVFKVLQRKVGRRRFDVILHFGLATISKYTRLERRAKNRLDFVEHNKRGSKIIKTVKILPGGPRFLYSTISMKAVAKELKASKRPYMISNNAGGYICNLLLYQSLLENKKRKEGALIGFVHVPKFSVFSKGRSLAAMDIILKGSVGQVLREVHE